jgi:ribonucleotide monophosphatase NagD (HAD superfamily)
VKGRSVIGNSPHVVRSLLAPYSDKGVQIPFALMTNGGGIPEPEKAEDINKRLGLPLSPEDGLKLHGDHMILCHTPLKDPELLKEYADKYVIVTGTYEELHVAQVYGYKKAIHVEELSAFYND